MFNRRPPEIDLSKVSVAILLSVPCAAVKRRVEETIGLVKTGNEFHWPQNDRESGNSFRALQNEFIRSAV